MENEITINPLDNPQLVNDLISQATEVPENQGEEETKAEQLAMEVLLPSDNQVELLAGIYNPFTGEHVATAEIRELNGVDEEALSKIKDYGKSLLAILKRGTVKIGDQSASQDLLDNLLSGDREYLILKIRIATLGSEISIEGNCPFCEENQPFEINLEEDITLNKLEDPSEIIFEVDAKVGKVQVELPNGKVQKKLVEATNKTAAELDSILLAHCVTAINDLPIVDKEQVRTLGIQDRRKILKELTDRNPGPDLESIKKSCNACGQEVPIPLTLADIFRL